ncbi:MAG: hypothetical protein LBF15_02930 [Candidatus Peribacteria bacterium]|nr:hypothetical protein [Candidatus Peribacteria bacterium]
MIGTNTLSAKLAASHAQISLAYKIFTKKNASCITIIPAEIQNTHFIHLLCSSSAS